MSFSCKCKFSTVMYSSIYTSITIVTVSRVSFEQLYNRVADAIVAISVTFWIQSKKRGLIFKKKETDVECLQHYALLYPGCSEMLPYH